MKIRESVQKRPKPVCTGILPEYQVPYCDPPEYDENDRNKKRRKKIEKKYQAEYLPPYNDANDIFDIGDDLIFDEFYNKKIQI